MQTKYTSFSHLLSSLVNSVFAPTSPQSRQFIYRGYIFNYPSVSTSERAIPESTDNLEKLSLIYRGHTVVTYRKPLPVYQHPRAINWRYAI